MAYVQMGVSASSLQPGHSKFIDQPTIDTDGDGIPDTGDGEINANDRVLLGSLLQISQVVSTIHSC